MPEPSEREQLLFRMTLALAGSCIATEGLLLELVGKLPADVDQAEARRQLAEVAVGTSKYIELMQEWRRPVPNGG